MLEWANCFILISFGFGVGRDDANCLKMYIDSYNQGVFEGKKNGVAHFVLATNSASRIANFNFDSNRLWWENSSADISFGDSSGSGIPGLYAGIVNNGMYSNVSVGKVLRHGNAWLDNFGINAWFNNQTYFEVSKHLTTGVITANLAG